MAANMKSTITLSLNSTAVKRGIARLKASFMKLGKILRAGFKAAGVAAVAMFGAATVAFNKFRKEFDRVGKLATRLNETPETIQRIGLAAKVAGTDVETMVKGLQILVGSLVEAERGSKSYAAAAEELGISTAALIEMRPEQQLLALSKAYVQAGQSGRSLNAIIDLLGRAGGELVPLLVQGPEKLQETMDAAIVVSDKAVRRYEKFNDQLTIFAQNVKATLAEAFAEPLKQLNTTLGPMFRDALEGNYEVLEAATKVVFTKLGQEAKGAFKDALFHGGGEVVKGIGKANEFVGDKLKYTPQGQILGAVGKRMQGYVDETREAYNHDVPSARSFENDKEMKRVLEDLRDAVKKSNELENDRRMQEAINTGGLFEATHFSID